MPNFEVLNCFEAHFLPSRKIILIFFHVSITGFSYFYPTEFYYEPHACGGLETHKSYSCLFSLLLLLGWDQSDKFVKIYITLTGVHQVPPENVQVHFTER
jgi:hypothetical protein